MFIVHVMCVSLREKPADKNWTNGTKTKSASIFDPFSMDL